MKIPTSNLSGPPLDWAVSRGRGKPFVYRDTEYALDGRTFQTGSASIKQAYSTSWVDGGPIINELFGLGLQLYANPCRPTADTRVVASLPRSGRVNFGSTALVAAMRCFVASELGREVDVPDELASMITS